MHRTSSLGCCAGLWEWVKFLPTRALNLSVCPPGIWFQATTCGSISTASPGVIEPSLRRWDAVLSDPMSGCLWLSVGWELSDQAATTGGISVHAKARRSVFPQRRPRPAGSPHHWSTIRSDRNEGKLWRLHFTPVDWAQTISFHVLCMLSCFSIVRLYSSMNPPGSSVHGILQARILKWVAISSSRGSSQPGGWTSISVSPTLAGGFFPTSATWEARTF